MHMEGILHYVWKRVNKLLTTSEDSLSVEKLEEHNSFHKVMWQYNFDNTLPKLFEGPPSNIT